LNFTLNKNDKNETSHNLNDTLKSLEPSEEKR